MIQAHNCNKFYHSERPLTLPICDRLPLPGMADPRRSPVRRSGAGHATGATKVAANALAFRPVVKAAGHEAARWAGARVPAARPGPVAGFLQATGFDGSRAAAGWDPKAWDPKA